MASARVTKKGQITQLAVKAGDRIHFVEFEHGFIVVPATRDIRALKGIVPRTQKPVTIEHMHQAISKMGRMS